MSRIEQWLAVIGGIIVLGGAVVSVNYWYLSNAVPALIGTELDKRDAAADANRPDEIVAALSELSTQVETLTTSQEAMKLEIDANFKFLIEKVMEL